MIFKFRPANVPPTASLAGGTVRWRPVISLGVRRPAGGPRLFYQTLVDTGADDILLLPHVATYLGLDLRSAPAASQRGVSGEPVAIRYAEVELTLAMSATHYVRWRTTVGFAPVLRPLFGFAGGLQYFHTTFDWAAGRFSLTPRADIPLTDSSFPGPDAALRIPL